MTSCLLVLLAALCAAAVVVVVDSLSSPPPPPPLRFLQQRSRLRLPPRWAASSTFDPDAGSGSSSNNNMGGMVAASAEGALPERGERTFASYVIYKSKCAVSVKAFPATFEYSNRARVVSREGGLFLEFANSAGPREYDWSRKGTFLMSATECGELLMMDPAHKGLEFFHDPNMGSQTAGQVTKRAKFAPAPDGKGVFLSLAVNDKSTGGGTYSVPVSWGELQVCFFITVFQGPMPCAPHRVSHLSPPTLLQVIKSIAQYGLPYFLGFDQAMARYFFFIVSSGPEPFLCKLQSCDTPLPSSGRSFAGAVALGGGDDAAMGGGGGANYSTPPPPPPPLYKDFWGSKEQYQMKP